MKMFKKSSLTLGLGLALAASSSLVQANSLLFPYFTTANGAQSVMSLASSTEASPKNFPTNNIHYVYNYGDRCQHFDGYGTMTVGDLMQHSVADPKVAGGFGLVTPTDKSKPFYFTLKTDGFVVVSNVGLNGDGLTDGRTSGFPDLVGSMVVADPTSGLLFTYKAISSAAGAALEGDFSNITDTAFTLSWYPDAIANTTWYAVVAGNMHDAIINQADWTGSTTWTNGGVVRNNDEVAYSGTSGDFMQCRGIVPRDSVGSRLVTIPGTLLTIPVPNAGVMTDAQNAAINNGGVANVTFGRLGVLSTPAAESVNNPVTGVVLSKIETVLPPAGAPFAGKTLMHIENGTNAASQVGVIDSLK